MEAGSSMDEHDNCDLVTAITQYLLGLSIAHNENGGALIQGMSKVRRVEQNLAPLVIFVPDLQLPGQCLGDCVPAEIGDLQVFGGTYAN